MDQWITNRTSVSLDNLHDPVYYNDIIIYNTLLFVFVFVLQILKLKLVNGNKMCDFESKGFGFNNNIESITKLNSYLIYLKLIDSCFW